MQFTSSTFCKAKQSKCKILKCIYMTGLCDCEKPHLSWEKSNLIAPVIFEKSLPYLIAKFNDVNYFDGTVKYHLNSYRKN